jgi:hypothetical protein
VNLLHYPWCRRFTTQSQEVDVRRVAFRATLSDFLAEQSRVAKRSNVIHDRPFADLALVSDVLVRRPALALITGVVGQLDQHELAQRVADANLHGGNH